MAWNDSGAYGHPKIRTPNIDKLAAGGLRFERAFLTCSSCSPSRTSILTGRYPHATGAQNLHDAMPGGQLTFVEFLRDAGYYTASAGKWHLGRAAREKFDRIYGTGGPSGAEKWTDALEERPKDRPFFLWLAAVDPHRGYREDAIETPHSASDAVVPPFLPNVEATKRDLALYYDEIARMDDFMGRVLAELDRQGAAENTLVLFLSDNGRPFPRCKTTVYDSGVRTPFIARWPKGIRAGQVSASLVSSVDIAPTFLELAGVNVAPVFQGTSFVPILDDPSATTRAFVFAEQNWHDYTAHKRLARSASHAYVWNALPSYPGTPPADAVRSPTYRAMLDLRRQGRLEPHQFDCFIAPRAVEELYDVDEDPHQLTNVVHEREHGGVLAKLKAELHRWKARTADWTPESPRPDGFHRETGERLKAAK